MESCISESAKTKHTGYKGAAEAKVSRKHETYHVFEKKELTQKRKKRPISEKFPAYTTPGSFAAVPFQISPFWTHILGFVSVPCHNRLPGQGIECHVTIVSALYESVKHTNVPHTSSSLVLVYAIVTDVYNTVLDARVYYSSYIPVKASALM